MSYPLLQFVASPDIAAAVRFDFNQGTTGVDGSTEVLQDGFSLGSPTLQGDPDGIGSEYGFRELSIPLRLNGTTTSAPAKFATLARELGRQTNWLRFQATSTSTPYWFQTYRSAPEPLDWEQFRNLPDATVAKWYVDLKLDADSFAVGAHVTLPTVTITNDPAVPTSAINPPTVNTPSTATTGGTLAAATYFYVVTALTSAGESTISNRVSRVTTGTTSTVTVTWTAVTGATGYRIYRSTTSGSEKFLASVGAVATYTDTGAATTATAFPTVNTTAGNPTIVTLPAIVGDVPAPLECVVWPSNVTVSGTTRVSVVAGEANIATLQAFDMTAITDATAPVADSTYAGGSYRSITFASDAGLIGRLTGNLTVPVAGRYEVFARVSRSDATSAFSLRVGTQGVFGPTVQVTGATGDATRATLVSLGEFDIPVGAGRPSPGNLVTAGVVSTNILLYAGRVSGSGQLRFDYFVAVPVSSPDFMATTLNFATAGTYGNTLGDGVAFDGGPEVVSYAWKFASWTVSNRLAPSLSGSFPTVAPGVTNRLSVMPYVGPDLNAGNWVAGNNYSDQIGTKTTVDLAYRPRWLYLAAS